VLSIFITHLKSRAHLRHFIRQQSTWPRPRRTSTSPACAGSPPPFVCASCAAPRSCASASRPKTARDKRGPHSSGTPVPTQHDAIRTRSAAAAERVTLRGRAHLLKQLERAVLALAAAADRWLHVDLPVLKLRVVQLQRLPVCLLARRDCKPRLAAAAAAAAAGVQRSRERS
jgi:hypothetical protein